jgi:hypothetical protein
VNNSVLNTPGFRAAGWFSGSTNPSSQAAAAQARRASSPPIPTTAAVSSEYYRFGASRDANTLRRSRFGDYGEDEEGGMVTGKSNVDVTGRRQQGRSGKRTRRRDRQQTEQQKQREADEDDSSDLSDESDDDGDSTRRLVCGSMSFDAALILCFPAGITHTDTVAGLLRFNSPRCRFAHEPDLRPSVRLIAMRGRKSWSRLPHTQRQELIFALDRWARR